MEAAALAGTAGGQQQPLSIVSMSETSFTLSDGLVVSQPLVFLHGEAFLWDAPPLDAARAAPNGQGWEEWLSEVGGRDEVWKLFELVTPKPGEWFAGHSRSS